MKIKNLKSKLRFFLNLFALGFVFLFSVSFSFFLFKVNVNRYYQMVDEKLSIAVHSLKYILPQDYHEKIKDKNSISKDEYDKIKETLNKLIRDIQIEYIYTLVKENGKFYFTSTNTKTSDIIKKIDPNFYDEYSIEENSDLKKIDITVNKIHPIYSKDKWGNFRTVALPEKTKSGKIYLIAADMNLEKIQSSIHYFVGISILVGICIFFPFAYLTYDLLNQRRIYEYIFIQKRRTGIYLSLFITIVFTFIFSIYHYQKKKNQIYEYSDSILLTATLAMKSIIPIGYHEKLNSITPLEYEKIVDTLSQFAEDIHFSYLYSIIEENGKLYYATSSEIKQDLDKGLITKFKDEVTTFQDKIFESIRKNKIIYFNEFGTEWGSFRTVLIPIKSIIKKDYVLAADIPIQSIEESIQVGLYESILGDSVFFLSSFSFLIILSVYLSSSDQKIKWKDRVIFVSLKFKLGFFTSAITVICISVISYIFLYNSKIILQNKTMEVCRNFAINIANIAREDLIEDNTYTATNSIVSEILKSNIEGLMDVYIINVYGKYVVDFNKTKVNEYAPETEISYIQSVNTIDLIEEFSIQTNRNILKITFPILIEYYGNTIKIGVAIFEYDRDIVYNPIYEMQNIVAIAGLFTLLLTILLTLFLSSYITKPLLSLAKGAQIIAAGNLDHEIPINTNDEVGVLSERFNEMSSNLKKSYDELEIKVTERTSDLVKSQAALTTVLSNAPLILFSTDVYGIITLSEGRSLNLIGLKSGQANGVSILEMFEDNPDAIEAIISALDGEPKILRSKIEQFTFEINYSPLFDINNEIIGLIALYFDVTENIKAQEIISAEKEKSDKLLLNILPEKIANELKEKGFVKPVLYDSVTVIFTDFKGFTRIASQMSPEDLLDKLDMIFLQFDQICERRNIEKLKTIGDAYMCAGGLPEINSTHPIDACLAAIEMQHFMNETKSIVEQISGGEFWDMRLGIHTGTVVAGVIGKTKFAYDVWGDAVNTASRMESNGSIAKINISDATYNSVKDFFECEYRGKIEAKNKGMIDMYFLLRIKPELSRDREGFIPNELFFESYNNFKNS
ncbi:MAG: HAMP domain-containing protein [Leptospiraceae bacterium]|nr:HAMP domain-containing protein [Leptospiraceae bacterium]